MCQIFFLGQNPSKLHYTHLMSDEGWQVVKTDGRTMDEVYAELWKIVAEAVERSKIVLKMR